MPDIGIRRHAACKGKGFMEMTKAECDAAKGTFEPGKS